MKRSIVHLTTLLQGGAGRAIVDLAVAQVRDGYGVDVVTSKTAPAGYGNYPAYLEQLAAAGVGVHLVDSTFSRNPADNLNVSAHIVEHGLLAGASVVHAHAATPALVGLIARGAVGRRVPVVQTMHGWGVRKTVEQQRADLAVMSAVEGLVVPAASSARVLRAAGLTRPDVAVVAYGVSDGDPGVPGADVRAVIDRMRQKGRTILACIGTIGDRKNQALLVEAIARMRQRSRVVCLFVGDGDADSLQALADSLGVGESVSILGYRPDASSIAKASDWFVLPSRSEGQPLSILEAFRDRVPVMASRIPELAELVQEHETGLLFDPEDAAALASRLDEAVDMPRETIATTTDRARARFDAAFTLPVMVRGYCEQYASAARRVQRRSEVAA